MDIMVMTAALAGAEKIINAALVYDPATRIALTKLEPQVLAVKFTAPEFTLFVMPTQEGVRLLAHYEGDVTTQLSGSASALLSLLKGSPINLKNTGVQVNGNLTFLTELQHILQKIDIDWEEMLSQVTGDIIGHQSADMIRAKMGWAKDRLSSLQRLTTEFLTEELSVLPSKPEVKHFNAQVDNLRFDVDRIEARISQLAAKT
jgi:ubiquinone biosynthesis accessory factor UbiJ